MTDRKAMTYGSYLNLRQLLSLQETQSDGPEHDEMLFIIIHQVYELWFKQVLHELDQLSRHIAADALSRGDRQLLRILKILKTLVAQLDVLETMTPLEFMSFRSFLGSASGFQSGQFREIEFVLGFKDPVHLDRFRDLAPYSRLERRYREPSLWSHFVALLARKGYPIPADVLERPHREAIAPSEAVQDALIQVYHHDPELAGFCELLLDIDEGVQEWRYRHVMMVRRTIGTRGGTGGSEGAAYLQSTLFRPAFPDLWTIRTRL